MEENQTQEKASLLSDAATIATAKSGDTVDAKNARLIVLGVGTIAFFGGGILGRKRTAAGKDPIFKFIL